MRHNSDILALYLAHRRELVNYASGIVGNRAQAEDLVQEAWLRFDMVAERRLLEEPIGYLYRIVRNLAVDDRRRVGREERVIAADGAMTAEAAPDRFPSPEAQVAARDELRRLKDAMATLPERTRIALEMRRFGSCKLKDIAAHLGISITVAHDIVAEGIAHCRRYVRPQS